MTEEQFIEVTNFARDLIREHGFVSGANLAMKIAGFMYDKMGTKLGETEIPLKKIFQRITKWSGYESIEYTTKDTEDFRVKDLFYYNYNADSES